MNDSHRQYELHLTAEPRRLAVVRRIVAAHLRHWNLPDLVDPTVLGVTELLANVYRHVGSDAACMLRLSCSGESLRCEVHDGNAALPRLLEAADGELSGRGLALVAACSKDWGAEREDGGKVVWFTMSATPDRTGSAPPAAPARSTTRRLAPAHPAWTAPPLPDVHRDGTRERTTVRARA